MLSFLHPTVGLETAKRGGQSVHPSIPPSCLAEGRVKERRRRLQAVTSKAAVMIFQIFSSLSRFGAVYTALEPSLSQAQHHLGCKAVLPVQGSQHTGEGGAEGHTPRISIRTKLRLFELERQTRARAGPGQPGLRYCSTASHGGGGALLW